MKRSLMLLGLAVVMAAQVFAQSGTGMKGGLSYGSVSDHGVSPGSLDNRSGFVAGIGKIGTGKLAVGAEALYARRGLSSDVVNDHTRVDYIDTPFYLRVLLPIPLISPFAYAGTQVSLEVKCRVDGEKCPSGRSRLTYGTVMGGGVRLGAHGPSLEGRYLYRLPSLNPGTLFSSKNYKQRSFMLLLGLGF